MHSLLRLICLFACTIASTAGAVTVIAPNITAQPAPSQTVIAGAKVSFSVKATGSSLKYQWTLSGSGNISGATKSIYTITKVVSGDAGSYQCIVYNTAKSVTSNSSILSINPNYSGKYNMAVINYNPADLIKYSNTSLPSGQSSGGALYGTATVSSGPAFTVTTALKGYLGGETGSAQSPKGSVSSNGVVTINGTESNLTINMVTYNGTVIGFVGTGTPLPDMDNSDDAFIVGLNATTTAPKGAALCQGNYTMLVISYNAADLSTSKASKNDGDAQIGPAYVNSSGSFSSNLTRYADSSQDTLGNSQTVTGIISSTGAVSSVVVQTGNGPESRPISVKFVVLNGQVIGFTGTFKPASGQDDSGILLGIRGSFTPLDAPSP